MTDTMESPEGRAEAIRSRPDLESAASERNAIASLLSDRPEAGTYAKVEGLLAQVETLTQDLRLAKVSGWCDVCCGTGKPTADVPCMCGGSGLAADAVIHLRVRVLEAEQQLASLSSAHERLKAWQPMETARGLTEPFLISFAGGSKFGHKEPSVEMVGGYVEYEELLSYGEPVAFGWMPLPKPLQKPLAALPSGAASSPNTTACGLTVQQLHAATQRLDREADCESGKHEWGAVSDGVQCRWCRTRVSGPEAHAIWASSSPNPKGDETC